MTDTTERSLLGDMAPLMHRVRQFLESRSGSTTTYSDTGFDRVEFIKESGFVGRRAGRAEVILSSDVAVELGHPSTASLSVVLCTHESGLVQDGSITLLGPDLGQMDAGERRPFGQIVLLQCERDLAVDPFDMDNVQYLTNRLPGYMVRSIPGRLWARTSARRSPVPATARPKYAIKHSEAKALHRAGSGRIGPILSLRTIGRALLSAYGDDFDEVVATEVVFVTSCASDIEALTPIATEARILAGRHKRLVLGADGVECSELDCDNCEEKPVCDNLRDVVILRRREKK